MKTKKTSLRAKTALWYVKNKTFGEILDNKNPIFSSLPF